MHIPYSSHLQKIRIMKLNVLMLCGSLLATTIYPTNAASLDPQPSDYVGKWTLVAGGIQAPAWIKKPTKKQTAKAEEYFEINKAFQSAFDYLEIKQDGTYNWHQPGDSGPCFYCDKWTYADKGLLLDGPLTEPRLDMPDKNTLKLTYRSRDPETPAAWVYYRLVRK